MEKIKRNKDFGMDLKPSMSMDIFGEQLYGGHWVRVELGTLVLDDPDSCVILDKPTRCLTGISRAVVPSCNCKISITA